MFLSLTMLLILALIGTILEGTRVHTAWNFADRALLTSMDGALAEYYRPLYDDYHLFFMEKGINTDTLESQELLDTIKEYLLCSFYPERGIWKVGNGLMNLYGISIEDLALGRITRAPEYNGSLFLDQIIQYMKYKVPLTLAEDFSKHFQTFQSAEKSSQVIEKKMDAEAYMGDLNKDMMDIMELTEGLSFGRKGLKYTKDKRIKTEKTFIKKLCPENITSENLGIGNTLVWQALKESYVDVQRLLQEMEGDIEMIQCWEQDIQALSNYIAGLGEDEDDRQSRKEAISHMNFLEKQIREALKKISKNKKKLTDTGKEIIKKIDKVISILPKLKKKQIEADKKLINYEEALEVNKKDMEPSTLRGLQENLNDLKAYAGKENSKDLKQSQISRIISMEPVLKNNKEILSGLSQLEALPVSRNNQNLMSLKKEVSRQKDKLKEYEVKKLTFDYGSLVYAPDVDNPLDSMNSIIKQGTLHLLLEDEKSISNKNISKPGEMEQYWLGTETKKREEVEYQKLLNNTSQSEFDKRITDSFGEAKDSFFRVSTLKNAGDSCLRKLILYGYGGEHFKRYDKKDQINQETALDYEMEYLIGKKGNDSDNLLAVVNHLIFIRTVMDFISILGDKGKGDLAYGTALALVGFTGLEPLVRLTQTLILLGWAFEEALVDVSALLHGKKIPFLKEGRKFALKYEDLLRISKSLIQHKVSLISEEDAGGLLSYEDYLKIFFLMDNQEKICYRMMDLIQANMRIRYFQEFSMNQCIYGIQVKGEFSVAEKFLCLPFVSRFISGKRDSFTHEVQFEYSY